MKNESDLSREAAAIHNMVVADDTAGAIDTALGSVDTNEEATATPPARGRPPGKSKNKSHKKKVGAASGKKTAPGSGDGGSQGDAEQLPDDFLVGALATAVEAGLTMARRSGWTSPASEVMTEKDWCSAVAHCADALITKHFGDKPKELGEELALGLLVLPWLAGNIWKVIDDRRKSGSAPGRDGIRKDSENGGADTGSAAGNPGRSNDRRPELQVLGH